MQVLYSPPNCPYHEDWLNKLPLQSHSGSDYGTEEHAYGPEPHTAGKAASYSYKDTFTWIFCLRTRWKPYNFIILKKICIYYYIISSNGWVCMMCDVKWLWSCLKVYFTVCSSNVKAEKLDYKYPGHYPFQRSKSRLSAWSVKITGLFADSACHTDGSKSASCFGLKQLLLYSIQNYGKYSDNYIFFTIY